MAIPRKIVPAAFSVGVDTGKDPKLVAQGLLQLENCIIPRAGTYTIRNGSKLIDAANDPFTEPYCAAYKDKAVLIDDTVKMAEGSILANQVFQQFDTNERWKTDYLKLEVPSGTNKHNAEVIEIDSIRVWTYMEYNSVGGTYDLIVETYNRYSGRLIAKTAIFQNAAYDETFPRLVPNTDNTTLWLLYVQLTNLYWSEINVVTGAISAPTATTAGILNNVQLDAVAISTTEIMAAHAGLDVTITYIDTNLPATANVTIGCTGNCDTVGVWKRFGLEEACVAYFDDADLDLRLTVYGYSGGLSQKMVPTDIINLASGAVVNVTGVSPTTSTAWLYYSIGEVAGPPLVQPYVYRSYCVIELAGGTGIVNSVIIRRSLVASKAWLTTAGANHFLWVTYDDGKCAYLIDTGGNVCGKIMPEAMVGYKEVVTGGGTAISYFTPLVHLYTPGGVDTYATCLRRYDTREGTSVGDTHIPMQVGTSRPLDFQSLEVADTLLMGGSLPTLFDGKSVVEQGYLHTPESPLASAGGAGGSLSVGTYLGAITYRWRDSWGRLHESAPSPATVVTVTSGQKITWTIPYLSHTMRADAQVCLWRSKVNQSIMYLRQTWVNSKTLDTVAAGLIDGDADSSLTGNEQIYTLGSPAAVLENIQPPQSHIRCEHQNRVFEVDDEYPATRIRYTKEIEPNVAPEHSDSLVVTVPPDGGDITALASDVDRLLVFKEHRIFYFTGTGLNKLGGGLGYQGPRVASDNKGCIGVRLLAVTDPGVVFCGYDRIYLLTKTLQVSPVGDPVRYYTEPESAGKVTLKAVVHQPGKNRLVVFTTGAALVLDLLHNVWGTWGRWDATDACLLDGLLLFKYPTDGSLRYEAEDHWQDAGAAVTPTITTGIFNFGGLGGVEFIDNALIYAYCLGAHYLHVAFQYDSEPHVWADEQKFDARAFQVFDESKYFSGEHANYRDNEYVLDAEIGQDQCSGLRMKIWITGHTGLVQPIVFVGLAFRLGVQPGLLRLVGGAREIPLAP